MQVDHLSHIFHFAVHGQFHAPKDGGNHLRSHEIVVVKGPAGNVIPALATGFPDVVEECCPAQPQLRFACNSGCLLCFCQIVYHLKGVIEIVLVGTTIARFHNV